MNNKTFSWIRIIAANLLVLIGVLFWGWGLGMVLLLYWVDLVAIFFFILIEALLENRKKSQEKKEEEGESGVAKRSTFTAFSNTLIVSLFLAYMIFNLLVIPTTIYTLFIAVDASIDAIEAVKQMLGLGDFFLFAAIIFLTHSISYFSVHFRKKRFDYHKTISPGFGSRLFLFVIMNLAGGLLVVNDTKITLDHMAVLFAAIKICLELSGYFNQKKDGVSTKAQS